jgi:hypothetical protein
MDDNVIDEWLKMYRPILYNEVYEVDDEIWASTEKEVLESFRG